jgi:hypothetical protein
MDYWNIGIMENWGFMPHFSSNIPFIHHSNTKYKSVTIYKLDIYYSFLSLEIDK